jgi:glycosyltransferase involved in cell wall biosynthesis
MRILHVINNGTACGGAERLTADLAEEQRAAGHLVRVLSSDRPGSGEEYADTTWPVPTGRVARAYTHLYNSAAKAVLAAVVRDWHPDVVHLHTVGLLSPPALSALAAVPTVMTVHGPELFVRGTLRWCLPPGYFRGRDRLAGRLTAAGWLAQAWAAGVTARRWRRALRHVDLFAAPSPFLARLVAPLGSTRVVRNGLRHNYFAASDRFVASGGARSGQADGDDADVLKIWRDRQPYDIVFAGRLEDFKGPQILIAAMPAVLAAHPHARLTIAGTGPLAPSLRRLAAELAVGHAVQFVGWQTPAQLAPLLAGAAVAAVPSLWPESFGLSAVEALAAGCAVVATDSGGLADVIRHGETGLLVSPADPAALAAAINTLLGDQELARRLTSAGHRLAGTFTMAAHADAVADLYRDALVQHARRISTMRNWTVTILTVPGRHASRWIGAARRRQAESVRPASAGGRR